MSSKKKLILIHYGIRCKILFYNFLYLCGILFCLEANCLEDSCSEVNCPNVNDPNTKAYPETLPKNQHYKDLIKNILQIKHECGDLCEPDHIDIVKDIPDDKTFKRLEKATNCDKLWSNSIFDQISNFVFPPQKLPKYVKLHFSRNNSVEILPYYLYDTIDKDHENMKLGKHFINLLVDFMGQTKLFLNL